MQNPIFIFESFSRYYRVKITNLETLSVSKIQEIERFVSQRKGIFSFETYSFEIQKNISFEEFKKLLSLTNLNAIVSEEIKIQKAQPRVGFGQYKGLFYSELPNSYMLWLKSNYRGYDREKVERELSKRGISN
jgi:hypothetical protein